MPSKVFDAQAFIIYGFIGDVNGEFYFVLPGPGLVLGSPCGAALTGGISTARQEKQDVFRPRVNARTALTHSRFINCLHSFLRFFFLRLSFSKKERRRILQKLYSNLV
jgi:hypothetical protein